jgi:hypothetical protein
MIELLAASNYPIIEAYSGETVPVPRTGRFGPLLDRIFGSHTRLCTTYGWVIAMNIIYPDAESYGTTDFSYRESRTCLYSNGSLDAPVGHRGSRCFPQDIEDKGTEHYLSILRELRNKIEGGAANANNPI